MAEERRAAHPLHVGHNAHDASHVRPQRHTLRGKGRRDSVNPRQIALVAWALVALVWVIFQRSVRPSMGQLLRTALSPKLLVPACLSLAWNAAVLFGLYRAGLWDSELWWDTSVFVLGGTTALVWRMSDSRDYSWRFYRKVLLETSGSRFCLACW